MKPNRIQGSFALPMTIIVILAGAITKTGLASSLTRLFDVTLTKDHANCSARADVIVDGKILLPKQKNLALFRRQVGHRPVHPFRQFHQ